MHINLQLPSVLIGVLAIIALSTVTTTGVLDSANLSMMDKLFALKPSNQATPPILLVSTTEAQRRKADFLPDLITQLDRHFPRDIFLLGHFESLKQANRPDESWLHKAILVDSVQRLKAGLIIDDNLVSATNLQQSASKDQDRKISYLTDISMQAGHYRQWSPLQTLNEQPYVAFQVLSSVNRSNHESKGRSDLLQSNVKIIDFSMEDGLLPLVTARRVLDDALSADLARNKIIIIGEAQELGTPGFTVPLRPETGISLLELQGYVLHSLLNDRFLKFSNPLVTLLGMLIIGVVSVFLFQWLPPHVSLFYTLFICLLFVIFQWFSVKFNAQILPVWEWIFTQCLTLLVVYQVRRIKEEAALNRMIAETNSRLAKRVQPLNFNRSKDPWKRILSFINQQLNLERSIFLEKVSKQHRVKEIEALNCSIDDISELRRDYERAPYSDALEENGPIVPFRKYFDNLSESETEYLIPLTYAGDVLGFWALTLKPDEYWNKTLFENNLRNFSIQISELVFHRNHWVNQANITKNPLRRLFSLELGQSLHKQLTHSMSMLEHRLDTLEDVFNGLSSAAIVYDVFGQVLHTNSIIEYLARVNNIAIYKLTAMELMSLTGEINLDDARKKLRFVTLKNQTLALNSQLFKSHSSHLLRIRPLTTKQNENSDQVNPFQVLGILFEFIDISQIQQHIDVRHEISDKYFLELRNKLEAMNLANRRLDVNDSEKSNYLSEIIKQNITEISLITKQAEDELLNHAYMSDQQIVPLNIVATIEKVIADLEDSAQVKNINFSFSKSDLISLSYVEPNTLEQLITAILTLLIQDATPDSIINILTMSEYDQHKHQLNINFTSMGKGVPKEQLSKAFTLNQAFADNKDDPLNQISILSNQVRRWEGNLVIHTEIGSGFSIDLTLKTFDFSDLLKSNDKEVTNND